MSIDKKARRIRIPSFVIMVYMVAAFSWWVVLLNKKIAKSHELNLELLDNSELKGEERIMKLEELNQEYNRQRRMMWGEGLFFGLSLSVSVFLVYQAYRRQLKISKNQTNFLLAVTHELKSPIASISLILQTLLKHALKLSEDKQQKLQTNALRETKRLDLLVSNLLLTAQLDAAYKPYLELLNLYAVFEKSIKELEEKHPDIEFSLSCEKDVANTLADKAGMTAVVNNLLGNAIKYGIEPIKIDVDIKQKQNKLIVNVADNGIGIPGEEKKNVFKRFYRSGDEAIRKTKGTGLGLFIVKEIINAHEGKIQVKDNLPQGVVFVIELGID